MKLQKHIYSSQFRKYLKLDNNCPVSYESFSKKPYDARARIFSDKQLINKVVAVSIWAVMQPKKDQLLDKRHVTFYSDFIVHKFCFRDKCHLFIAIN